MATIRYRFLFIDDNVDYHQTLTSFARDLGASLRCFEFGDEGLKELKNNPGRYHGVILDFNCIHKKGQKASEGFLANILADLNDFDKLFPKVVLSGFPEASAQKRFNPNIKFFDKNTGAKDCIKELIKQVKRNPLDIIKEEHSQVFAIFEKKYLEYYSERFLIDIIQSTQETGSTPLRKEFASHRLLLGDTFKAMVLTKPNLFDPESKSSLTKFSEKTDIGPFIDKLATEVLKHDSITIRSLRFINQITRTEGHHNANQRSQVFDPLHNGPEPTLYTLNSVFNALMDYLIWFQIWMDKNK